MEAKTVGADVTEAPAEERSDVPPAADDAAEKKVAELKQEEAPVTPLAPAKRKASVPPPPRVGFFGAVGEWFNTDLDGK